MLMVERKVEIFHLATPQLSIELKTPQEEEPKNMTNHPRKKKHSALSWIQEIIVFIYNYVLSYFEPDQEYTDAIYIDHWKYIKPWKDKPQISEHE